MDPFIRAAMDRHGGVFATGDAVRSGIPRTAIRPLLRSGEWWRIRHGVFTSGAAWRQAEADDDAHRLECAAVLLRLGSGVTISHGSAARLHGLVVPPGLDREVRLTDPTQFRSGRGYRVAEASVDADEIVRVGPLRLTSIARTLVDVGREWDVVDTVVAMDDALADGRVTRAELTTAVLRQTHWPAIGRSARAADLARVGAHSPHETRSRLALVGAGLPEPLLQAAVLLGRRLVAILDMLWEAAGVFGECDGKVKTDDPWRGTPAEALWAEKSRHDTLLDLDLRGVRIRPADLYAPLPAKVERVRSLLAAGATAGPLRYRIEQWKGGLRTTPRAQNPA